ncbi:MAG: tetratricopeptide repeat protein [Methyloceanibacter sp.]|nr:tetratricopeptide repeat protein [Methyloceanibacter sp.]
MRRLVAAFVATVIATMATESLAQDFDDGVKAVQKGDFATAVKIWTPLAEKGSRAAQFNLAVIYDDGMGIPEDNAEAAKWYRKAAENGFPQAQLFLGNMYVEGEGVPEDNEEGLKWFRKAAKDKSAIGADAQARIGRIYERGIGVEKDDVTAYVWFSVAAANGSDEATLETQSVVKRLTSSQLAEAQQRSKRCMASGYEDCEGKSTWDKIIDVFTGD